LKFVVLKIRVAELYAERTRVEVRQIATDMDRDSYFTPREAAEYGVVDQVITHADELQSGSATSFLEAE